ncbi:MAG: FtsX-like permease family protein [Phototrophicaceae bacterium]
MPSTIILRLAGRHINRRFLQSMLFILGVALGVAMIIAIDIANGSARRAFSLSAESVSGQATHRVSGGPAGLPSELYRQVRVELGLRDSAPVVTDYVRGLELDNQPLRLFGVDPFAEPPFRQYLEIGRDTEAETAFDALNRFIAEPRVVMLSQPMAARFGVQVGDTITLRAGSRAVEVEIIGLLQPNDRASEQALDDLVLADIATAQEIVGRPGRIDRIDLILPEADAPALLAQIEALLPDGALVGPVDGDNDTLAQMTAAFELNLQALSLLALVVGGFLIYNTVTFSVVQRRPEIGILRSVGTTRRQIFWLVVGEAFVLGVVGTALGLGLGILFGRGAVSLVARTISDLYFTVSVQSISVTPFTLVKGAGIGLLASAGAAVIPAISATRTAPAGTMRRSDQERSAQRLVPLITAMAVILNLVGVLLLQIPTGSIEVSFAGLFAIVVGGAFFTPLALIAAMRVATPITDRLFGVIGRMAPRAVTRSLSRTSVAVAALTVSVSVIVGVSVMIASFRSTVDAWLQTTLGSDIYVSPPLLTANLNTVNVDPELRDLLRDVPGVASLSAARAVSVAAPDYPDLPPVNLQAVDSDISTERRLVWNRAPGGDYWQAMTDGAVMVSEPFAFRRGIDQTNNTITLLTDRGPHTFEVVAVFYDYSTDQGQILIENDVYRALYDDPFISSLGLFIEPGADIDTVMASVREALVDYDLTVQANRELRAGVFEVFDNAFAITVALRLLATLVAFIGILSALLALQLENTRQYGVMRANGMTPRQLWNFTLIQTGLMGGVAGALAIPIGLALALVLLNVINVRSFGWTMDFYWVPREIGEAFMVALVGALLAGIYPAWRLMRLVTARALRSE